MSGNKTADGVVVVSGWWAVRVSFVPHPEKPRFHA
jgi:hypothetical protein